MGTGSALDILREKDPGVAQGLQTRIEEQDRWNDAVSSKPIQVLDKIDAIPAEISKLLRRAKELTLAEQRLLTASAEFMRLRAQQRKGENARSSKENCRDAHAREFSAELLQAQAESRRANLPAGNAAQQAADAIPKSEFHALSATPVTCGQDRT